MLVGQRIAILATDGFEERELTIPHTVLKEAGANIEILSPENNHIRSWDKGNWGASFRVDKLLSTLDSSEIESYDALVLPGGVLNSDSLRWSESAIHFVGRFVRAQKTIAAICHGLWVLIDTKAVNGHTVTSWPSLKIDLIHAGAHWVDQEVVVSGNLITSRRPSDLPAFIKALIYELKSPRAANAIRNSEHSRPETI